MASDPVSKRINLVINKLTKDQLLELSSDGRLSGELSDQLFMTIDENEGGGSTPIQNLSGYAKLSGDNVFCGQNTFTGNMSCSGQNTFTGNMSCSGQNTFTGNMSCSGQNTFTGENNFSGKSVFTNDDNEFSGTACFNSVKASNDGESISSLNDFSLIMSSQDGTSYNVNYNKFHGMQSSGIVIDPTYKETVECTYYSDISTSSVSTVYEQKCPDGKQFILYIIDNYSKYSTFVSNKELTSYKFQIVDKTSEDNLCATTIAYGIVHTPPTATTDRLSAITTGIYTKYPIIITPGQTFRVKCYIDAGVAAQSGQKHESHIKFQLLGVK